MLLVPGPNVSQCAGSSGWRHAEHCVLVCSCWASMCWFRHLKRCSSLSDVGSSISSMLTCTTSPHCALVVSRLLALHSLTEFDSLSLLLSLFSHPSLTPCISLSLLSCCLSGSPSWSRGGGIHVPVLRTSLGPCRAPVLHPVPVLPAWMSSYSAA